MYTSDANWYCSKCLWKRAIRSPVTSWPHKCLGNGEFKSSPLFVRMMHVWTDRTATTLKSNADVPPLIYAVIFDVKDFKRILADRRYTLIALLPVSSTLRDGSENDSKERGTGQSNVLALSEDHMPTLDGHARDVMWWAGSSQTDLEDFKTAANTFVLGCQGLRLGKDLDLPSGYFFMLLWHSGRKSYVLCHAWPYGVPLYPLPSSRRSRKQYGTYLRDDWTTFFWR